MTCCPSCGREFSPKSTSKDPKVRAYEVCDDCLNRSLALTWRTIPA